MSASLQVVRAFDRTLIEELPTANEDDLERMVQAAEHAFRDRARRPSAHQRAAVLQGAATLLEGRRDAFAELIALEGGKPLKDALIEVTRAVDGLRCAADELRTFAGREIPMGLTAASEGRWAFTTKEPLGIVAAISAFNHPLNLIVHQVAPAVAVGCPVIVKPSAATPLSCLRLVALLREAGLEEPWCQVLMTADNALAERLAVHPRVAFLSFIGSPKVGWGLRSKLPPGTRLALEHGGAAPVIVDSTAELPSTIEAIVKGGYYHAGQVCVSVQRIFVHRSIDAEFIDRLAARVATLSVGDPLSLTTDVGPLIHPREVERVFSWVEEARQSGARIIGGGRLSETTLAPAIVIEPPRDAKVSTQEIFGPVTCVSAFDELDEAVDRANALPFAFQASIFSRDIAPALRAARRFDASAVLINDHTAFRTDWMPFAGRRQSGYGIGGIPYTMHDMTQDKMIVLRHGGDD